MAGTPDPREESAEPVAQTRFRVLGPLEVLADERVVELGGPQQRVLLALLLLDANRVVSTDFLNTCDLVSHHPVMPLMLR